MFVVHRAVRWCPARPAPPGRFTRPAAHATVRTMCTLAAYVRVAPEIPLLIAANRDEYLDRPSAEPGLIAYEPRVFAGQDLSAGGTWFGVNQHGMVVGLLNRRQSDGADATRRSR